MYGRRVIVGTALKLCVRSYPGSGTGANDSAQTASRRAVSGRLRKTALRCPKSMHVRTGRARTVFTRRRGRPAPGKSSVALVRAGARLAVAILALVARAVDDLAEQAERGVREA